MKNLKNERGMTLVIVLLTITVFSVLGLAVMSASVTNVKQVKKAETDIQTVDAAEMGVQYYNTLLKDFFHEQIALKKGEIKTLIQNDYVNKIPLTDEKIEEYEKKLGDKLIEAFNSSILFPAFGTALSKDIDVPSKTYFQIKNLTASPLCPTCNTTSKEAVEKIEFSYESYGFTNQQPEKKLTGKFVFTFSIDKAEIKEKSIPAQNHDYTTLIPKPTSVSPCSSEAFGNGKNGRDVFDNVNCSYNQLIIVEKPSEVSDSQLVFDNGVQFIKQMNKGIEDSTLYITGAPGTTTIFNKQVNGIHNSKIFVKGNAQFETVNQGIHNSTIVVVGNAKFGDGNDKLKKLTHSSIYVIGNADMTDIDFSKFDSTAKICVKGTITGDLSLYDHPIYSESYNKVKFDEKCSLGVIQDGDKTIEITDQFMDWAEEIKPIVNYN
ncbi:type II secretion system protein [Neobacillus niacini]|uniref:type II secretion system protein n=1 Tax=Neobacillus niacini TaxID=86668 RepID=UPI0005EE2B61|nr:type II secretion system protein [Neobacillus niacini]